MNLGGLSTGRLATLWAILTLGLILRLVGLDWGLPRPDPETARAGLLSSYAFDEDNVLRALTRTDPASFDIDPELYHWGTLHFTLTLIGLEAAQTTGFLEEPWRRSFLEMRPGEFSRVYVAGRAVSVAMDLLAVFLTFLLGRRLAGAEAGLWAAALIAVSPGHILQAGQIRVDVTATALVALTALLALARVPPAWIGLAAGLAASAKYSACLPAAAAVAWAIWPRRRERRPWLEIVAGAATGFLIGEPFVLTAPGEVATQVGRLLALSREIPPELLAPKPLLLVESLGNMARFSLGVPAFLLALVGLWRLTRRRAWLAPLLFAAGLAALIPQNWPLLRYHLPLLPIAAAAASVVIIGSRAGRLLGLAAVGWAAAIAFAVVEGRSAPHPANLALDVLRQAAAPGDTVARIMPEIPPLDPQEYPAGPNPLTEILDEADPPRWVVLSSLPIIDYPRENIELLARRYETLALFRSRVETGWLTFGETGAPQDWKYASPQITIYRLR